jgi:L-threonylcarbamoyladenylate synthase
MNDELAKAVDVLRHGGVVAFPTETVYGLGADATNADAVRRVFALKGRPATNPLIVHVASVVVARRYAAMWPARAEKLAARFWPGPLTLVLPKVPAIVAEATAGLGSVGLRVPNHPVALELLRAFDGPVAAPSANRSNHVSPTTAQHVRDEFGDAIKVVLDGGASEVGIESTVLDLSGDRPRVLRPGVVTREQIAEVLGEAVDLFSGSIDVKLSAGSPGQQERHYSPRTPAFRHSGELSPPTVGCGVILLGLRFRKRRLGNAMFIELPDDPKEYAKHLYEALRELDAMGLERILVHMPPDEPRWVAVRDRLRRATVELPG